MNKTTNEELTEKSYIQVCIEHQTPVYCWLANGVRLAGTIYAQDSDAVFLKSLEAQSTSEGMLAFKMQITSIVPISARTMTRSGTHHLHAIPRHSIDIGD
jgi:sRNA-binding regulator protein Hfq